MNILKIITPGKASVFSLFKFLKKNAYIIIFTIVIISSLMSAIKVAKETNNPAYPVIHLVVGVANADSLIYDDVQTLKENPTELIGMEKPKDGVKDNIRWYWALLKVFWRFLGNLFLITTPFKVIYWIFKQDNLSTPAKNAMRTLKWGLIFVVIANLVLTIISLIDGTASYKFVEGLDTYQKVGKILVLNIPFHGIGSLLAYIASVLGNYA